MNLQTPAANIIIGTIYLLFLGLIAYVTKRAVQLPNKQPNQAKSHKYNIKNMGKALKNQKYAKEISLSSTIIKSMGKKYSLVGSIFFNQDKLYLLKEIFIISIICIACTALNSIIVWPVALTIPLVIINFCILQIALRQECGKTRVHDAQNKPDNPLEMQIQPQIQRRQVKPQAKISELRSMRYIYVIALASFVTLILVSQTMFILYNSISNLGVLNIGSVAVVFVIDQLLLRPAYVSLFVFTAFVMHKYQQKDIYEFSLILNLCQNELLTKIHQLEDDFGTDQFFSMRVSPTKKKQISPTKIPKAALYFESETLMNLEATNRMNNQSSQKIEEIDSAVENVQSPIRDLAISKNSSIYLTSAQRQMFNQNENEQMNQNIQSSNQIKKNYNQFYSAQRLPKDKQATETIEGDNIILVETGLNAFKLGKQKPGKSSTLDVDFSPAKRRRVTMMAKRNKRQLVITGNSPYLQYLPNMMKKTDKGKKSLTPSQPQIASFSRKVL